MRVFLPCRAPPPTAVSPSSSFLCNCALFLYPLSTRSPHRLARAAVSVRVFTSDAPRRDEQFTNYQTSTYKLHLYETPSGYKFVMLSDPAADSLRFVLRQIHSGPFVEYVVRNPLVDMDSRARGIDNEYFRMSTDRLVRGLTVFQ